MKRTFIAFDIIPSSRLNEEYEHIRKRLRDEKIAWTAVDNLHITLTFLGDTEAEIIPDIVHKLQDITGKTAGFEFSLQSFGVFKNPADPRVIWFGCGPCPELVGLKKQIDLALTTFGFEPENREFSPHLTLGRVKFMRSQNQLVQLINQYRGVVFQSQRVDQIVFYESKLTPGGSIYTPLHTFVLQQNAFPG